MNDKQLSALKDSLLQKEQHLALIEEGMSKDRRELEESRRRRLMRAVIAKYNVSIFNGR